PSGAGAQISVRASADSLRDRPLRPAGWDDARVSGPRNDLRAVQVLRPTRSDGTGATTRALMATISADILASYAADAARDVDGVHSLVESGLRHKGVRIEDE